VTRLLRRVLTFTALLLLPVVGPDAYELSGRLSSDFYAYQNGEHDHYRPYLRFYGNMLAWRGEGGRSVRFHTSLRWSSDFADEFRSDPQLFVYDAYAYVSQVVPQTDLYAGRQFVYSGAGSALIDGGRARVRIARDWRFDFFGGSLVSSEDPEKIQSFNDNLVLGGRVGGSVDRASRIGLSWMMRKRDGDIGLHRVALDGDRLLGPVELFARVGYNLYDLRLSQGLGRVIYRTGPWYLSGEFDWREPSVPSSSIFSLVDFDRYSIGRVELRRKISPKLSLVGHVQTDFISDDNVWRTGLGVAGPFYALTWIHQTGYAGENDGISGYLNMDLASRWQCYAGANLYRYRVQLQEGERIDSYASTLGLQWRAGRGVTVRGEGQYLHNAVSKEDYRLFLRVAKHFSFKSPLEVTE